MSVDEAVQRLKNHAGRIGIEQPVCLKCDRTKYPVGRSIPMEVGGGVYCSDGECDAYRSEPKPDNLYPGEETMFEFVKGEDLRLVLAELDRLRTENIDIMTLGNDAAAQMCERIAALEAITDPCGPDHFETEYPVDHRALTCDRCGGLGRVPRAPQTERLQFCAKHSEDGPFLRVFNTENRGQFNPPVHSGVPRDGGYTAWATVLTGSGSWETQEGQQQ